MNKVLIVEDDPFLADIYITKFTQEGFNVRMAGDGETGLQKLEEEKPEIILLDIILPRMDGFAVLKKIKEDPKFKDIPVLLLTNLGQKEEIERGLKLGASQYLIKAHHSPKEVIELVKKTLAKK
jgi:DNA-binding response OmpR family regulator